MKIVIRPQGYIFCFLLHTFPKKAHPKIGNVRSARVFVFLITKYVAIYASSYIMPAMYLCFSFSMEIHFQDFDTQAGIRQHAYLGGEKHYFFILCVKLGSIHWW